MPVPDFVLSVEPNPEEVEDAFVAQLEKIDESDTYELLYFFGNLEAEVSGEGVGAGYLGHSS